MSVGGHNNSDSTTLRSPRSQEANTKPEPDFRARALEDGALLPVAVLAGADEGRAAAEAVALPWRWAALELESLKPQS